MNESDRSSQLEEIITSLRWLMSRSTDSYSVDPPISDSTYGGFARALVKARSRIGQFLDSKLFTDPAYDILLDLFASEAEGRQVNISSCALAARIPSTTGLRWVCLLENRGLIERYAHHQDQRLALVRLTPSAKEGLRDYLTSLSPIPLRV